MRTFLDLEYKEGVHLDLYLPDADEFDVFVYFHGGGLCAGSKKEIEPFVQAFTDKNVAVASVEYRMYPNAKYPEFIEDCAFSVRWLKDNIQQWGKCKRLFVGGTSAGAYISMLLCFDKRYFNAVGIGLDEIDGYVHNAGQPTSHFNVLKERGLDSRRVIVDETAPLFFIGLEENYPPMLFLLAKQDMFARFEQTQLVIKTLAHFGHKENVFCDVIEGTHCSYVNKGERVFSDAILSFFENVKTK